MRKRILWLVLFLLCLALARLACVPIQLYFARYSLPQAIVTLGGGPDREEFTAQFAKLYPELDIWISSGTAKEYVVNIFTRENIPLVRLHLDYRAVDTLTNFTTLVPNLKNHQIHHVYLITSDIHQPRAQAIAFWVFGSQNITYTPIPVASDLPPERLTRILRDRARAILWVLIRQDHLGNIRLNHQNKPADLEPFSLISGL
jgi:uncharacterized SAM-binding protein YcdF (DUF218 family)